MKNPLPLLIIGISLFIFSAAGVFILDARSFSDLPTEAKVSFILSMGCFSVIVYYYLVIPFWTWIKRLVNGE